MILPRAIHEEVEAALPELDGAGRVEDMRPVSGGCINNGCALTTTGGHRYFLKWREQAPPGMYRAEADGLRALDEAVKSIDGRCDLRLPEVVTFAGRWLLLEYVEPHPTGTGAEVAAGRDLARLHRVSVSRDFGWEADNWIGTLPQVNAARSSWGAFWWDARLSPQLERARSGGFFPAQGGGDTMDRLARVVGVALEDVEQASLLHGDLWSGNVYADRDGRPVLIDPAVYRGHSEVDLAMTELFGGFGGDFYAAYGEEQPLDPAYAAYRRDLYQLYYLLVHVNLFGRAYVRRTLNAAERVVAALT